MAQSGRRTDERYLHSTGHWGHCPEGLFKLRDILFLVVKKAEGSKIMVDGRKYSDITSSCLINRLYATPEVCPLVGWLSLFYWGGESGNDGRFSSTPLPDSTRPMSACIRPY